jgi:hypothetical protein
MSELLAWLKRRFEARQMHFAETGYRAARDRAAQRKTLLNWISSEVD